MSVVVRSAVILVVAAFGLCGCGSDNPPAPPPSPVASSPSAASVGPPPPAPLPPPSALTDVLYRLADPAVPGGEKIGLIEKAGPGDAAALDRFARALADNGYHPMTFDTADLAWAPSGDDVVATVIARTPPGHTGGDFTFPMEFARTPDGGFQLTRDSADMLLEVDAGQSPPR
jgi:hypothetical protein